ncbi:hypothetical protein KR222_011473, partial [Zaprionus bogoriensis]
SPLIPLDVICENGISRKLNFLQLNEALNSGRIQLFPNGPKTPTTDRKAKTQQRFWHGLGDENPSEQDPPLRDVAKPRATLNFDESMMMSPVSHHPQRQPVKAITNNRFSQADELMLDNTNFLVHAKVGDETQSRNSSKCTSRRETTYNNTTMELDNLEKDEAAVPRHTLQKVVDIEEDEVEEGTHRIAPAVEQEYVISRRSLNLARGIAGSSEDLQLTMLDPSNRRRQTLHQAEPMEEDREELHHNKHSQTIHRTEPIEEDKVNALREAPTVLQENSCRRQTLHLAVPIEEDMTKSPQQLAPPVKQRSIKRRDTLRMAEAIEEDLELNSKPTAPAGAQQNTRHRETMHMAEAIKEELILPEQDLSAKPIQRSCRNRQTLHLVVPIEEDLVKPQQELVGTSRRRETVHMDEAVDEDFVKPQQSTGFPATRRETVHMVEAIEEEKLSSKSEDLASATRNYRHRQTLHMAEPITEETIKPIEESIKSKPTAQQSSRRRETVHMAEAIEEELMIAETEFKANPEASLPTQRSCRNRQTLHLVEPIEEELDRPQQEFVPKSTARQNDRRRATVYGEEAMEEDSVEIKTQQELPLTSTAPLATHRSGKHRETVHMAELIEEELAGPIEGFSSKPSASAALQRTGKSRGTIHMTEPIEEEIARPREETNSRRVAPEPIKESLLAHELTSKPTASMASLLTGRRRETLLTAEAIEEDSLCLGVTAAPLKEYSKQRRTVTLDQPIDELEQSFDMNIPPAPPSVSKSAKQGAVFDISDPFADDVIGTQHVSERVLNQKQRKTLHMAEPIEEEEACNAASISKSQRDVSATKQYERMPRKTITIAEAIEEDDNCIPEKQESAVKMLRQTLHVAEAIDEDLPTSAIEHTNWKPKLEFQESMDIECRSTSAANDLEKAMPQSRSSSSEWLAQANIKERQAAANTLFTEPASPEEGKYLLNPSIARLRMETPKMHKKSSYFAITPGRSMIEYEDLEAMCNNESSIAPVAVSESVHQAADMEMDMDISSYGTPVQVSKPTTSFNIKRLPTHLTPNLPQAKKRQTQLPVEAEEQTENKSRIPVPSKTLSLCSPSTEPEQLDGTVQMVRAQMMRQTRSDFSKEVIRPMKQKLKAETYEDNPITISDVSNHFAEQHELANGPTVADTGRQPTDAKNMSMSSRSSNENSKRRYAKAHQEFINISGDTVILDAAEMIEPDDGPEDNEIEKTRLSLVSSLLDESDDRKYEAIEHLEDNAEIEAESEPSGLVNTASCLQQLNPPAAAGAVNACKKCKHCRCSMSETIIDAHEPFALPDWHGLEDGLERLERLRQQPSLEDVQRYWQLKKMERYSCASDALEETGVDINEPVQRSWQEMLQICNKRLKELPKPKIVEPFVNRLDKSLRVQSPRRWIFDYQLQCDRQYVFTHRKITTLRIVINYEPLDIMEREVRVKSIKGTTPSFIPESQYTLPERIQHMLQHFKCDFKAEFLNPSKWSTFEYLLDFQLRLKFPLNLHNLLEGNDVDGFLQFLQRIDSKCRETAKLCAEMRLVLIENKAQLLRQSNRTVVQKTVRKSVQFKDEAYMRVDKTCFIIEIGNVEEISFSDIVQPPMYEFDEKIQYLPKGIAFLRVFLPNPEQFLRS